MVTGVPDRHGATFKELEPSEGAHMPTGENSTALKRPCTTEGVGTVTARGEAGRALKPNWGVGASPVCHHT